jgi:hypothetical protein
MNSQDSVTLGYQATEIEYFNEKEIAFVKQLYSDVDPSVTGGASCLGSGEWEPGSTFAFYLDQYRLTALLEPVRKLLLRSFEPELLGTLTEYLSPKFGQVSGVELLANFLQARNAMVHECIGPVVSALRQGDIETSLEAEIVAKYVPIQGVSAIYTDRYQDERLIFVLLSTEQYDDALMDRLLDKQFEIEDVHPDLALYFRYMPLLGQAKESLVGRQSKLIFER